MLDSNVRIAIYAEAAMGLPNAKMAEGILRYGQNPVAAVIDSKSAGRSIRELCGIDRDVPIVASLDHALKLRPEALVLGTAPSGGRLPSEWIAVLEQAIDAKLSIVNGLHDRMAELFGSRLGPGQWIWDIREPKNSMPPIATARASELKNTRVLMIGTDMAIGKMSAGIEIWNSLTDDGCDAVFLPTGQTGIAIMGYGIPLDAFRVDHAAGAVEQMVMEHGNRAIQIIEGQGSLLHPGSTANLPLMRGSCCNAMVLVHRAGMNKLDTTGDIFVPPLGDVISLYETTASANGALTPSKVVGIALNTRDLSDKDAVAAVAAAGNETGLPVSDPVRHDARPLANAVLETHRSLSQV